MPPCFCRRCCSYDFGSGAGFYLDASEAKWQRYRMYSYITRELPALLRTLPELDIDRVGGRGRMVCVVVVLRVGDGVYASMACALHV